ncbi:MAG: hypothetical protein OEW21_04075 [Betaproteobacteria bacterium]|nr:hypothetical protein [Betaproteobacteria bacterium]
MKRTDLEKFKALKIVTQLKQSTPPDRFAQGSALPAGRRAQRRLDRERGLVPFAVKIDAGLALRVRELAGTRAIGINELVEELLKKGLAAKD